MLRLLDDYEDVWENGKVVGRSKPGHEGHLMSGAPSDVAAQDEIDRLGNFIFAMGNGDGPR